MEPLMQGNNKLTIEHVSIKYSALEVLNDLSFDVKDGEFLSILGASGCGKTTILRILVGLLEPDTGSIHKDGKDITHLPPAERGMGIVFQNYALFENMTVLGNVEYALKYSKQHKANARVTALRVIEQVGLSEHIDKRPYKLSGGQQQRVALARTLALNPDVILMDEPMSALDAETRLLLRAEIKSIQRQFESTIIYVTHDQEEAFAMSDRIMVMKDGDIQQLDTPERIMAHPQNDFVQRFVVENMRMKIDSLTKFSELNT